MAEPFVWGMGGQKITTPQQAKRQRDLAAALRDRPASENWTQGLGSVTAALAANSIDGRVGAAEEQGARTVADALAGLGAAPSMEQLTTLISDPWVQDNPGASSVASALLGQQMEQNDPMYSLQRQKLEKELALMGQPENPYLNVGGGSIFNTSSGEFMTAPDVGGQKLPADVQEYNFYAEQAAANGQQPLPYLDYLQAQKGNGLSITTADGTVIQQGGGKPLTEGQSKDTVYFTRASAALPIVDKLEQSLLSLGEAAAGTVPAGLGNYLQSEDYQVAQNAGKEFLASILRKDTGAAVTPSEEKLYGDIFLPRPGDKPATIARKRQARAVALAAIEAGMPAQAIQNAAMALEKTGTGPEADLGGMPTAPASVQPTDDVVDWTDYFNGN